MSCQKQMYYRLYQSVMNLLSLCRTIKVRGKKNNNTDLIHIIRNQDSRNKNNLDQQPQKVKS